MFGQVRDYSVVLFIFAGFGIGAGFTIDGNMYLGVTFASGNIGHKVVDIHLLHVASNAARARSLNPGHHVVQASAVVDFGIPQLLQKTLPVGGAGAGSAVERYLPV